MPILTAKSSSVARSVGGVGEVGVGPPLAPHWHAEYAKYPVFNTFETNFYSKSKNSPPIVIGKKNMTALTLDLKRIPSQNSIPMWANIIFLVFPYFGQKKRFNSNSKLF